MAQEDAIYCFSNGSPTFTCNPPFPIATSLQFYVQVADEEPGFGDLQTAGEFTGAGTLPYDAAHRYEYAWAGQEGRLWLSTFPSTFPDTGLEITGSFTVQVFRE